MFPIDKSLLPSLTTRQALVVIDLQNDFVLADGSLPVTNPEGYVDRIVELARSLREIGSVDIIWVRSEFERHRPAENEQILTTDLVQVPVRTTSRGRARHSAPHMEQAMEEDDEAFLSTGPPGTEKPACVRPGEPGSELAARVRESRKSDYVLTKTHYSAFQGGQLLQLLRGRFVTELYVCGALTNVSIYATALDAGKHGYGITIVEDCCGYRSETRHMGAVQKLVQLTGCEVLDADALVQTLRPGAAKKPSGSDLRRRSGGAIVGGSSSKSPQQKAVRDPAPKEEDAAALLARLGKLQLSRASPSADHRASGGAQPQPAAPHLQPLQHVAADASGKGVDKSAVSGGPGDGRVDRFANPSLEIDPELQPASGHRAGGGESPNKKESAGSGSNLAKAASRPSAGSSALASRAKERSATEGTKIAVRTSTAVTEKSAKGGGESRSSSNIKAPKPQIATREPKRDQQEDLDSDSDGISSSEDIRANTMANTDKPTPSAPICEGETTIIQNALPPALASTAFDRLKAEVAWQRMSHQGGEVPRLVAVQGAVEADGSMPVYRHPSDESPPLLPFSPTVVEIKSEVEKLLGHPLNHVLIQFYRDGNDYISEHSDKTLDICPGSFIANVSLGAERTMVFRTKRVDKDPSRKPAGGGDEPSPPGGSAAARGGDADLLKRRVARAALPHNSLCRMGLVTNMRWLHAIRQDKRLDRDKTPAELAFGGGRISLTFRRIGTFLSADSSRIWGQGATSKTKGGAKSVVNGQTAEAVRMLQAFGIENHSSEFEWDKHYGGGFDVLHMSAAPRFFAGPDAIANARVGLLLAERGVLCAKGNLGVASGEERAAKAGEKKAADEDALVPGQVPVRFVDNDVAKTIVNGELAILLYLDAVHCGKTVDRSLLAKRFACFQLALALGDKWRAARKARDAGAKLLLKQLKPDLAVWEEFAAEQAKPPKTAKAESKPQSEAKGKTESEETSDEEKGNAGKDQASKQSGPEGKTFFIAGGVSSSVADAAFWPVLHEMHTVCGEGLLDGYPHLQVYYAAFGKRESVKKVYAASAGGEKAQR